MNIYQIQYPKMSQKKQTKSEIEAMVALYAKKAMYNSNMGENEVKDKINTAVIAICKIAEEFKSQGKEFRFGVNNKVTAALMVMRSDIRNVIEKRAKNAKSLSNKLNVNLSIEPTDWNEIKWIDSVQYEKSYNQRLSTYSSRLRYELEAFVAVGMVSGRTPAQIAEWFMFNISSPHTNVDILNAFDYAAIRTSKILKVGKGGITSAYKSIVRLNEDMMVSSYHISNRTSWGAIGMRKYVMTMRDNLVCSRCEANVGFTFPANEYVVPTHNRCRCYEVPIMPEEL
jgi:hypothetical protein